MLFKNIILYQLAAPFTLEIQPFQDKLSQWFFSPCPKSENSSMGWVSPYGQGNEQLVHGLKGFFLIAFCKEEKILPGSVIAEELAKKIALIEKSESRPIYRKEKKELREQIVITLRHQAFSRKKIIYAYIDVNSGYLIVDTSSRNKAEEICSFLRKTLGSLKLALPQTKQSPETMMTSWLLKSEGLTHFNIENNCEMIDPKQKSALIKCKEQDLNAKEIVNHLHSGKQVVKLALNWQEKISFDFSNDLVIKKIKFLNLGQDKKSDMNSPTLQEQLDANFAMMTGEFSSFLKDLWHLFDGLTPVENQQ